MITVMVVAEEECRPGLRMLLEQDGDILVVGEFGSFAEVHQSGNGGRWRGQVMVVDRTGVDPLEDARGDGKRIVELVPAPGVSPGYLPGAIEAPMELSGRGLRAAVRRAAQVRI